MYHEVEMPSKITGSYWIYFDPNIRGKYDYKTGESGKWLLFFNESDIDIWWDKLKFFINRNKYYLTMKCTTKYSHLDKEMNISGDYVICLYCSEKIALKLREELREFGVTKKIPYKLDKTTSDGKYSNNSSERVSTYYC